jgi:type IV secretory pathway protease TraF
VPNSVVIYSSALGAAVAGVTVVVILRFYLLNRSKVIYIEFYNFDESMPLITNSALVALKVSA